MANELEKQFFNTFDIEPIGCNDNKNCTGALDCTQCPNAKYPTITDRILLELICMLSKTLTYVILAYNIDELKQYVLSSCIRYSESIDRHQIRTLFKEYKND